MPFPRQTLGISLPRELSAHIAAPQPGIPGGSSAGNVVARASSPAGPRPLSAGGPSDGGRPGLPTQHPHFGRWGGAGGILLGCAAPSPSLVTPGWPWDWDGDAVRARGSEQRVTGASATAQRMPLLAAASRSAPGLLPSPQPPGLAGPGCCESRVGCGAGGFPSVSLGPPVPLPMVMLLGPDWRKWVSEKGGSLAPPTMCLLCPSPPALERSQHPQGAFHLHPSHSSIPRISPTSPCSQLSGIPSPVTPDTGWRVWLQPSRGS